MGRPNYTYQCGYGRELKEYNVVLKLIRSPKIVMASLHIHLIGGLALSIIDHINDLAITKWKPYKMAKETCWHMTNRHRGHSFNIGYHF